MARRSYPSDVSDEEWALVSPYLALLPEEAGQRRHLLREVFNGLRYVVKTGAPWRWMPNNLPPLDVVYGQARRWLAAGVFEAIVHDLRVLLRLEVGRGPEPTAAILDSRTLRSTPESGARAGYDGAKRKKGSKVHAVVDTLGHLLALHVPPATADDRAEVGRLAEAVQEATGEKVEVAFVDQGYTGERAQAAAEAHGIQLEVVNTMKPSAASCSCPGDGSSSAPSPGPPVFAASTATTNDCPKPSQVSRSSPSPSSCSNIPPPWSRSTTASSGWKGGRALLSAAMKAEICACPLDLLSILVEIDRGS